MRPSFDPSLELPLNERLLKAVNGRATAFRKEELPNLVENYVHLLIKSSQDGDTTKMEGYLDNIAFVVGLFAHLNEHGIWMMPGFGHEYAPYEITSVKLSENQTWTIDKLQELVRKSYEATK